MELLPGENETSGRLHEGMRIIWPFIPRLEACLMMARIAEAVGDMEGCSKHCEEYKRLSRQADTMAAEFGFFFVTAAHPVTADGMLHRGLSVRGIHDHPEVPFTDLSGRRGVLPDERQGSGGTAPLPQECQGGLIRFWRRWGWIWNWRRNR